MLTTACLHFAVTLFEQDCESDLIIRQKSKTAPMENSNQISTTYSFPNSIQEISQESQLRSEQKPKPIN